MSESATKARRLTVMCERCGAVDDTMVEGQAEVTLAAVDLGRGGQSSISLPFSPELSART